MGVDNVYFERNLIKYYERGLKCEWHAKTTDMEPRELMAFIGMLDELIEIERQR
jgi:hypothetical protein